MEEKVFDCTLETGDWRESATIVGLIKYFDFLYQNGVADKSELYEFEDDYLRYNSNYISEENYLLFVEKYFKDAMHHKVVENILLKDELSEDEWHKKLNEAMEILYRKQRELNGQVSGEHGIGLAKRLYLNESLNKATMDIMRGIKLAFDPNNILNPGKVCE